MDDYWSLTTPELTRLAASRRINICTDNREVIIRLLLKNDFSKMSAVDLKRIASDEGLSPQKAKITLIEDLTNLRMFDYTGEQRYLENLPEIKNRITSQNDAPKEEPLSQKKKRVVRHRPVVTNPGRTQLSEKLGTGKCLLTVYTICKKCGEEIYGSFYTTTDTESIDMYPDFSSLFKTCPKCKSKLGLEEGCYIESYIPSKPDKQFEELHKKLENDEKARTREAFNSYIAKIEPQEDLPANNNAAKTTLSSLEKLKEYILHLIHMESEVYLLGERLLELQQQAAENERSEFRAKQIVKEDAEKEFEIETEDISKSIEELNKQIKKPSANIPSKSIRVNPRLVGLPKPKKPTIHEPQMPKEPALPKVIKPSEPSYQQPGLFNKKKVLAENEEKKRKYNEELAEYSRQMNSYNEAEAHYLSEMEEYRLLLSQYNDAQAQYSSKLRAYETAYKKAVDKAKRNAITDFKKGKQEELKEKQQELAEVKKYVYDAAEQRIDLLPQVRVGNFLSEEEAALKRELRRIIDGRDQLYAFNIIYGKYRNYVALTSIYEYLDSGRCDTLDGPQGAYNLFELESRTNEIILQLSAIAASLEAIKTNQFMLYRELKRANHNLDTMKELMDAAITELHSVDLRLADSKALLSNIRDEVNVGNDLLNDVRTASAVTGISSVLTAVNTAATAHFSALTAHYSAIGAHYAKTNAELTDALGVMTALNQY